MAKKKRSKKRTRRKKKKLELPGPTEKPIKVIVKPIPQNLKFAMIVTLAVFWASFLKELIVSLLENFRIANPVLVGTFILAVAATFIVWFIFTHYRRIAAKIARVKVPV